MQNHATRIGVLDFFLDRREMPFLHCDEVLDRLLDNP